MFKIINVSFTFNFHVYLKIYVINIYNDLNPKMCDKLEVKYIKYQIKSFLVSKVYSMKKFC